MKAALANLKKKICSISSPQPISDDKWNQIKTKITVALMVGGESSRFQEVPGANTTNKNSMKLPNGDTMIEMTIRMYKEAGITNFVALVYHKAKTIEQILGDGSKLGVNIKYSYDPKKPVGKGGAVLNAIENESIPMDHHLIVHNPDDVILNYNGSFPRNIMAGHLAGEAKGAQTTVVVVEETPAAYTGMKVVKNIVTGIEMYPMLPIPAHIGVTIFSPSVYPLFRKTFNLDEKSDFEQILFPILSSDKKLYAVSIPSNNWLAVNNLKSYKKLVEYLGIQGDNI